MYDRDYRDIASGAVLTLIGASAAIYAASTLPLGSVARLGPGMFPTAVGIILALLGLVIAIPALFRKGAPHPIDIRSLVAVSVSILAFAVIIPFFGMVPAILVLTAIASRANNALTPIGTLMVGVGLSALAFLIFRLGLNLPIALFNWPW